MKKNGFTLLEVMIAISILTLAVGGSFALIRQALISSSVAESKLIASYLAQESIEIVRNIRDNNWLIQRTNPGFSWKSGLTTGIYEAEYKNLNLTTYSGEGRYLLIDGTNGFYTYTPSGSVIQTKFKRKITINEVGNNKLDISVLVFWSERGGTYNVEVREHLYNWYGY